MVRQRRCQLPLDLSQHKCFYPTIGDNLGTTLQEEVGGWRRRRTGSAPKYYILSTTIKTYTYDMAHKNFVKKEGYSLAKLQKIVVLRPLTAQSAQGQKKVQDLSEFL